MSKNIFRLIKTWALISNRLFFTALNFWPFCWQSTLNASETWLQWNKYCARIRATINFIL